jgi:hypothetical protein
MSLNARNNSDRFIYSTKFPLIHVKLIFQKEINPSINIIGKEQDENQDRKYLFTIRKKRINKVKQNITKNVLFLYFMRVLNKNLFL